MRRVEANKILYIKLGRGGEYEKECIDKGTIKLGYHGEDHALCSQGRWDELRDEMKKEMPEQTKTFHLNQIKMFYEEPRTTMWITFYRHKLWYCFAKEEVIYLEEESTEDGAPKERRTVDGWHCIDKEGNPLNVLGLNGNLTKVQAFRGTICGVEESDYLLRKINCQKSKEQEDLEKNLNQVRKNLVPLIRSLNPKDFEILVDLIFRYLGWSRFGQVGDGIRDIDIQLISPGAKETALVQVKSKLNKKTYEEVESIFLELLEDDKLLYLVYHTSGPGLEKLLKQKANANNKIMKIWDVQKVADFTLHAGLIDWLIKKTI